MTTSEPTNESHTSPRAVAVAPDPPPGGGIAPPAERARPAGDGRIQGDTPSLSGPARARRRAILCVLGASALFAVAAALVKGVAPGFPTVELVFFRSAVAFVATLPLIRGQGGWGALRTRRPLGHLWRTLAGLCGMCGAYYGYATLPLVTVTALGFAMPLFLAVLSVPLLGERITRGRGLAVLAGLAGVLIMIQPWDVSARVPMVPVLVVVGGVMAWALAMISIRRMGRAGEPNVTIVLLFSLASSVLSGLATVPVWVTPQGWQWAALIGVGLVSAGAQLLMTEGYRSGEATLLAPFEYGAILYTTLLGLLIWGEWPDWGDAVGVVVLVGSGLALWWQETRPGRG